MTTMREALIAVGRLLFAGGIIAAIVLALTGLIGWWLGEAAAIGAFFGCMGMLAALLIVTQFFPR